MAKELVENVRCGIESCSVKHDCFVCPYQKYQKDGRLGQPSCIERLHIDTLKVIDKEPEQPKKPIRFMDGLVERYKCECGQHLLHANYGNWDYCPKCGQAIEWEVTDDGCGKG